MKCQKCLEENPDGGQFCRRCGTELQHQGAPRSSLKWIAGVVLLVTVIGAALMFVLVRSEAAAPATALITPAADSTQADTVVHVGIAYGTEKRDWFTWAV